MRKLITTFIAGAFLAGHSGAGELLARDTPAEAVQHTGQLQDADNPTETPLTAQQQKSSQDTRPGNITDRPLSAHKVNYFSINHWPGDGNAQVKFQISMKFKILEPNLYIFKDNFFPAYVAYTQKSLWNVGQNSMPFEESNYNPEFFLDYPLNAVIIGRLKLRHIVISPMEHESNGLAGVQSRSWSRQYVRISFGLDSAEKLEITNSLLADKALLYIKLWRASGYSDQDAYLQSMGSSDTFLDYMGHGEIGVSVRNFLWGGSLKNHQLDIKTPIFRDTDKPSCELA